MLSKTRKQYCMAWCFPALMLVSLILMAVHSEETARAETSPVEVQDTASRQARALQETQALYEAQGLYEAGALYDAQGIYTIDTSSADAPVVSIEPKELAQIIQSAKGRQVLVNFWAPWCAPCVEEMPEFVSFYKASRDAAIRFVSVVVLSDLEERVRPFLKSNPLPFTVYYLNASSPGDVLKSLPWATEWDGALPATFLLNARGELAQEWLGATNAQELADAASLAAESESP